MITLSKKSGFSGVGAENYTNPGFFNAEAERVNYRLYFPVLRFLLLSPFCLFFTLITAFSVVDLGKNLFGQRTDEGIIVSLLLIVFFAPAAFLTASNLFKNRVGGMRCIWGVYTPSQIREMLEGEIFYRSRISGMKRVLVSRSCIVIKNAALGDAVLPNDFIHYYYHFTSKDPDAFYYWELVCEDGQLLRVETYSMDKLRSFDVFLKQYSQIKKTDFKGVFEMRRERKKLKKNFNSSKKNTENFAKNSPARRI